ncbi:MAG: hypothetical protein KDA89_08850 [Planctomycetaceae bacterium]|nr:hypothetical protein [Planctomycetaceae bacterium]
MLRNEAYWIGETLSRFAPADLSPLINLGSSTEAFRTVVQPHIDAGILRPLTDRGVRIIHSDLADGPGIDISGDIYTGEVMDRLKAEGPCSVLCSNMFEHVSDRPRLAAALTELLSPGGILLVTVPHSFPWHPDPLDTMYRPTPAQIHELLPEFDLLEGAVVSCGTLVSRYCGSPRFMAAQILGSLIPIPPGRWFRSLHHWCWLFRSYKVSCAVLVRK